MDYYTVKEKIRKEQRINKSRFIATLFPVSSIEDAKTKIGEIKKEFKGATHHPFALRIGHERISEKSSDDGEPARSSGLPILQEIKRSNITNILIIVTRFFGGTKLGLGGLNRAYRTSAALVLSSANRIPSHPVSQLEFRIENTMGGKVHSILQRFDVTILNEEYGDTVKYRIEIFENQKEECIEKLKNVTRGSIRIIENNV